MARDFWCRSGRQAAVREHGRARLRRSLLHRFWLRSGDRGGAGQVGRPRPGKASAAHPAKPARNSGRCPDCRRSPCEASALPSLSAFRLEAWATQIRRRTPAAKSCPASGQTERTCTVVRALSPAPVLRWRGANFVAKIAYAIQKAKPNACACAHAPTGSQLSLSLAVTTVAAYFGEPSPRRGRAASWTAPGLIACLGRRRLQRVRRFAHGLCRPSHQTKQEGFGGRRPQ